jgi:glutamate dehydrogenase (NAD(P)+)
MRDDAFRFADELGPAKIIHVYDPLIDLFGVVVIDNLAAGPAVGGLRLGLDVSTEECFRLARAMSLKNAAAGIPHGGGKSVLYGDPKASAARKEELIRAMAHALRDCSEYIFGPDMGTDETCMAWIQSEIGRAVGLPRELGGIPLDEIGATGWGVLHATEAAAEFCGLKLEGARIAIQGFGSVGRHAARFLTGRGCILVAACDSSGTIQNEHGLDVEALISLKERGESVVDFSDGKVLARDDIVDADCEIWIPAARPDALHEGNIDRLKARLVVPGANLAATPGAEEKLHERGVLVVPDFIANAGGVICGAMEYQGAAESAVFPVIEETIRDNTRLVLEASRSGAILPRQAAVDFGVARLERAMARRPGVDL